MDGAFGASRRKRKPGINITPLVDVMFLLLIFFMVSSTFRTEVGLDILLPQAATASAQPEAPHIIYLEADGTIQFNGEAVPSGGLRGALEEALVQNPEALFKLTADRAVPFEAAVAAIDTAREAGGERLIIETDAFGPPAGSTGIE